jgi:hypothetical protein
MQIMDSGIAGTTVQRLIKTITGLDSRKERKAA